MPIVQSMDVPCKLANGTRASRVFLVEDSKIIRERLLQLLGALDGVEVVGDAETAVDAIAGIVAAAPDVVVLDIKLKSGSGIEVLKRIKQSLPSVTVIMLTNYPMPQLMKKSHQAGADYFFDKCSEFESAIRVIRELTIRREPA